MKIGSLLKCVVGFLFCVMFIRTVLGTGPISVSDMLLDLQEFDFDYSYLTDVLKYFKDGEFLNGYIGWNSSLTGMDGFFKNVGNVIGSFFTVIINVLRNILVGAWRLLLVAVRAVKAVLSVALSWLGLV